MSIVTKMLINVISEKEFVDYYPTTNERLFTTILLRGKEED